MPRGPWRPSSAGSYRPSASAAAVSLQAGHSQLSPQVQPSTHCCFAAAAAGVWQPHWHSVPPQIAHAQTFDSFVMTSSSFRVDDMSTTARSLAPAPR